MLARLFLITTIMAGSAGAQDVDVEDGRDHFMYFCAECHGKDAASTGPLAEMLAINPPVLSHLSDRNGGTFPIDTVAFQIDGRIPIETHSYMPIFGPALDDVQSVAFSTPSGQPILVSQRLANLIAYLQSLQVQSE